MKKLFIVMSLLVSSTVFASTEVVCGYGKYIYMQDKNLVEEARRDLNEKLSFKSGDIGQLHLFQSGLNVAICVAVTK